MLQPPDVVGAGLAGLVTADVLQRAGLDVLVLTARQRIGGRAYTMRDLYDGQYAEGGAEFVDLDDSLMASYIQRFGLKRAPGRSDAPPLESFPPKGESFGWGARHGPSFNSVRGYV